MPARCFLAFQLPEGAIERLSRAKAAFVEAAPEWAGEKWVRPDLLHLTLKFIGPLDDAVVEPALSALTSACAQLDPASLELSAIRAVPSERRARMVWAALSDADGSCTRLAGTVDDVLSSRFGVAADERDFAPHVTLARARVPRRVPPSACEAATAGLASGRDVVRPMSVRSLTLYASVLGRGGPTYEALGEVPVGSD